MGTDTDEEYLKKDSSMSREVQSTGLRVFLGFSAGFSCLIVGFSIFQLVRIHVRLWQLRFQSRRLNFLAKRLFHVFLGLAFLVNFASTVFDLTSFCFANPKRDEAWWCFPVDATLKRLFSFLTLSAYLITLLFWTEFVYCIKYNAATGEYFIKYKRHIYAVTAIIITVFIVYVIMIFCHHDGYRKKHPLTHTYTSTYVFYSLSFFFFNSE